MKNDKNKEIGGFFDDLVIFEMFALVILRLSERRWRYRQSEVELSK